MKTLLALLLSVLSAWAVTLEWDANTETNLVGYRVYVGKLSRQYICVATNLGKTNTTCVLTNLTGTNFFAVTAFDTDNLESEFSDEVSAVIKPKAPMRLRFVAAVVVEQSSGNGSWTPLATNFLNGSGPIGFTRAYMPPEPPAMPK